MLQFVSFPSIRPFHIFIRLMAMADSGLFLSPIKTIKHFYQNTIGYAKVPICKTVNNIYKFD